MSTEDIELRLRRLEEIEATRAAQSRAAATREQLTPARRLKAYLTRAATTAPDALPYPNDYQQPADSPAAFQALAIATQAALINRVINSMNPGTSTTHAPSQNAVRVAIAAAEARQVPITPTVVTDWDQATAPGFYIGTGAKNPPSPTYFPAAPIMGLVLTGGSPNHVTQIAWPYGTQMLPLYAMFQRTRSSGDWGNWARLNNFVNSYGPNDGLVFNRHGGGMTGVTRFAHGLKKQGGNAPSSADEWRVQRYDTDGNYTGNIMVAGQDGRVTFPSGHTRLVEAARDGAQVSADQAATVGIVADMILAAFAAAGVSLPRTAAAMFGLTIGPPTPETDPTPTPQED